MTEERSTISKREITSEVQGKKILDIIYSVGEERTVPKLFDSEGKTNLRIVLSDGTLRQD